MEQMLDKLNAVTTAWKALPIHDRILDIPLRWSVDTAGMLWLDSVWICPASYIDPHRLGECARDVQEVCFEVPLVHGSLDVIIIRECDGYKIHAIERHI